MPFWVSPEPQAGPELVRGPPGCCPLDTSRLPASQMLRLFCVSAVIALATPESAPSWALLAFLFQVQSPPTWFSLCVSSAHVGERPRSLTDWRPQVRDLPVAVSTGPYIGHLLGLSRAAGAGMRPDSPGRSSWGDHGALSSPTTLQAHPLACCYVLAAQLWPPGLWSSLPLSF